jgi:hypothetical protein
MFLVIVKINIIIIKIIKIETIIKNKLVIIIKSTIIVTI